MEFLLHNDHDVAAPDDGWRIRASDFASEFTQGQPERRLYERLKSCGRRSGVEKYYRQQREIVKELQELDALVENGLESHAQEVQQQREKAAKEDTFAIRASNYANMVLLAAKVFVSVKSGSLAIIASTLDSLLDVLSGFILWFTAHTMKSKNKYRYPIGKNRMQPVVCAKLNSWNCFRTLSICVYQSSNLSSFQGILVFASVMATLGLQIVIESARRLMSKDKSLDLNGDKKAWVIGIMISVTAVKIFLFILCRVSRNEIVKAYAKDHFFDVVTNVVGLAAALLAASFAWWIDPAGAIVLAIYTIWNWSLTVLENVKSLVGETASADFLKKLIYLCWNHHPDVKQIDTVRAYTFGGHYFVEVDIVVQGDMQLKHAHDIGESLQDKLELLPEVERAFVHLDYEVSHKPEHAGS